MLLNVNEVEEPFPVKVAIEWNAVGGTVGVALLDAALKGLLPVALTAATVNV
jgi:hypothetical protein